MESNLIQNFSVIFISIVLEALPFIMLGAIVSAVIQVFVSENTIARILPKNKFLGVMAAALSGLIFPVCECAVIPIARRLIKKGVPLNMAVAFMLAVPIVNPVVLLSTYYAFHAQPYMVAVRGGFGLIIAVTIGILIEALQHKTGAIKLSYIESGSACSCGYDHTYKKNRSKFMDIIHHTNAELYDIGKFLIMGAFISAFFQSIISRELVLTLGQHPVYSIIAMMVFAYLISLCSEADAFIASTFVGQFTQGSIVAFLLLGPMIDIKNTLMLSYSFKKSFIVKLISLIFALCFIAGSIINAVL
jgi:uncharacterized membrane protein YraQ (UPF0718 family)